MVGLAYTLIAVVIVFAIIATIWIGNSAENRKENPNYDKRTSKNLIRLTLLYVIAIILCVGLFWWLA